MDKQNPVYTLTNECHDCYKCVRECHVKAIKIENGHIIGILPFDVSVFPFLFVVIQVFRWG